MEETTMQVTPAELLNCFRTSRRQGFITGVLFVIALNMAFKMRDQISKGTFTTSSSNK